MGMITIKGKFTSTDEEAILNFLELLGVPFEFLSEVDE